MMRVDGVGMEPVARAAQDVEVQEKVQHTNEDFLKKQRREITEELEGKKDKHSVGERDLQDVIERLNEVMDAFDIQARFSIHKETKRIVVKLVDIRNDRVIREIPPEKILDMVAKMIKFIGMLFDVKV